MYLPEILPLLSRPDNFLPRERFLEFRPGATDFSVDIFVMLRFHYFEGLSNQIFVYEMNHTCDYCKYSLGILCGRNWRGELL